MANCVQYIIECPQGAIGGECTWSINCCDGTKSSVTIPEEDQQTVCLEFPANIVRTSLSGNHYVDPDVSSCFSNCGYVDPTPSPGPSPSPAAPTTQNVKVERCDDNTIQYVVELTSSGYSNNEALKLSGIPIFDGSYCWKVIDQASLDPPTLSATVLSNYLDCSACTPAPVPATPPPGVSYYYWTAENCGTGNVISFRTTDPNIGNTLMSVYYNGNCYEVQSSGPVNSIDIASAYTNCNSCCTKFPSSPSCTGGVPSPTPSPTPAVPSPTPAPATPTPIVIPDTDYCLLASPNTNTVTIQNIGGINSYVFNGNYGLYGVAVGDYVFSNVPASHPIAFLTYGLGTYVSYTGTNSAGFRSAPDGQTYEFFYGDVTLTVNSSWVLPFLSYYCYNHGYMGGAYNVRYDSACYASPSPTPTPTAPSPTPVPVSVVPPIPSPVENEYTLSYSQTVEGWPSFYSFIPEIMLGMNQYFYSFSGGNLYQHNTENTRNNFYGVQHASQITTVLNQNPLENKIFKTINLESDQAWEAVLETDIQMEAYIDANWYEKKEGAYFAYIRQRGNIPAFSEQYAMRSANGIGKASSVTIAGSIGTVNFSISPLVSIGSIVSVGDYLYFSVPSYTTISLAGQVTNIEVDLPNNINRISYTTSTTGSVPITINDPYILYIKDAEAESLGLLGHYCVFTLENTSTLPTELFAVESQVMKSYP